METMWLCPTLQLSTILRLGLFWWCLGALQKISRANPGCEYSTNLDELSTFDYVVVGAGSAGSVLAARLSKVSPDETVLILETGSDQSENSLLQPSYFFKSTKYTHLFRHYFSQEKEKMNFRRLYHMNPKVLGGGSSINAMVWTRGDPRDWELWTKETGLDGWTYEDVLPHYKAIETFEGENDDASSRGKHGPIHVSTYAPNAITQQALQTAAFTFNVPQLKDVNGPKHVGSLPGLSFTEGATIMQRTIRGNAPVSAERQSTWKAVLQPACATQSNLFLQTHATVIEILIDEYLVAKGVKVLVDGREYSITARKEVIVCAGAHNSPKLLLLSGVGNSTELAELGIHAKLHLPGVGHNMKDHINPGSLIFYGPSRLDYDGNLVSAYGRTGVDPGETTPDVEYGYIMGPGLENEKAWPYVPSTHMFYCLMLNNDALGHVKLYSKPTKCPSTTLDLSALTLRIPSKDPLDEPSIESGYFKDEKDFERVVKIFRKLFEWAGRMNQVLPLTQTMAGPYPLRITPASSDADIISAVRNTADTHWHVCGTCAIGGDENPEAVLDGKFRVRGIKGLRVVDASSMPIVPNGHPMSTIIMLAHRAVDFIVNDEDAAL